MQENEWRTATSLPKISGAPEYGLHGRCGVADMSEWPLHYMPALFFARRDRVDDLGQMLVKSLTLSSPFFSSTPCVRGRFADNEDARGDRRIFTGPSAAWLLARPP